MLESFRDGAPGIAIPNSSVSGLGGSDKSNRNYSLKSFTLIIREGHRKCLRAVALLAV